MLGEPPSHAGVLHDVLRKAFEDVRDQQRSDRVRTTLQMLWADELLENQSQMQTDLHASADLFVRGKRREAADLEKPSRISGRPARCLSVRICSAVCRGSR